MSYFHKNLRLLREKHKFSQEQFAELFGLSKANIQSYEKKNYPKIEMLLTITDYFNIDVKKFIQLDMATHSVYLDDTNNMSELEREKHIAAMLQTNVDRKAKFAYLDNFSTEDLKKMYIELFEQKEHLSIEWTTLLDKYNRRLEDDLGDEE